VASTSKSAPWQAARERETSHEKSTCPWDEIREDFGYPIWEAYGGIDEIEEVFLRIDGMHHTDGEL
jgi:hypothetical protein